MTPGMASIFGNTWHVPHDGDSKLSSRATYSKNLWMADGQRTLVRYAYDSTVSNPKSKELFQELVRFWTEHTCMVFQNVDFSTCTIDNTLPRRTYGTLRVTARYGACHASLGPGAEYGQCTDLNIENCDVYLLEVLMLYSLGMISYEYRNDSRKYVQQNLENGILSVDSNSWGTVRSMQKYYCSKHGRNPSLAIPFDYASASIPTSKIVYTDKVERPIMVTYEPKYQYLVDYRDIVWLRPTFYDKLSINMIYKCTDKFSSDCKTNGKNVPKCKNYGYVGKQCNCLCPPGFSGAICENKIGPMFPLMEGVRQYVIHMDKQYDFRTLNMMPMPDKTESPNFKYYQLVSVVINPLDSTHVPSVQLFLPFAPVAKLLADKQDQIIQRIASLDCTHGARLLWGNSQRGLLACECTSTLVANEALADTRVFRGRQSQMSMLLVNSLGRTFDDPMLSVRSSEFRMVATFVRAAPSNDSDVPSRVNGTSTATTPGVMTATGAAGAMTAAASGTSALVGAVVGGLLLLLLGGLLLLFLLKRRKKKTEEAIGEEEGEDGNEGDSDATHSDED